MKTVSPYLRRGSALLITIFFVSIITLVVVAFMTNVRLERVQANSHLERMRAGSMAREGVDRVIATLNRETTYTYTSPDPIYPSVKHTYFRNYVNQPGAMIVPELPDQGSNEFQKQNKLTNIIPLSTGLPNLEKGQYKDVVFEAPELNIETFTDALETETDQVSENGRPHLITDRTDSANGSSGNEPSSMRVKWVYIRQNKNDQPNNPAAWTLEANQDDSEEPEIKLNSPIIGRYAYWVDEESTKINYNLAWKKKPRGSDDNFDLTGHPSRVNLAGLSFSSRPAAIFTEAMADAVHKWTATMEGSNPGRYFNSFADARQLDPKIAKLLDLNKFELTHFNHDPDTTFFGEDRILLTTNPKLVPRNPDGTYARKFLDILREDLTDPDPGLCANIAGAQSDSFSSGSSKYPGITVKNKLDMVVKTLVRYLSEENWPITDSGVSLKEKYYQSSNVSDAKLAQIAVNIIDYVRSRESTMPMVQFMRFGTNDEGEYTLRYKFVEPNAKRPGYQGVARNMYITELGMLVDNKTTSITIDPKKPAVPLYKCWLRAEVHLPSRYDVPGGVDLVPDKGIAPKGFGWHFNFTETRDVGPVYYRVHRGSNAITNCEGSLAENTTRIYADECSVNGIAGNTVLMPGDYAVITKEFYRERSYSEYPILSGMRGGLTWITTLPDRDFAAGDNDTPVVGSYGIQIVPQRESVKVFPLTPEKPTGLKATLAQGDTSDPNALEADFKTMSSAATDDPRCNVASSDWKHGPNSFGYRNQGIWTAGTSSFFKPTTKLPNPPQQDTDPNGRLTDYSMYMPPPKIKGSLDPENGQVTSLGELGYINTGVSVEDGCVPWRSLRLQPSKRLGGRQDIPDWVLMDLFAVPNSSQDRSDPKKGHFIYSPHGTAVAGRININSEVLPFRNVKRDRGLVAVFLGANDPTKSYFDTRPGNVGWKKPVALDLAQAEDIAYNISNRILAPSRGGSAGREFGYKNAYDTPGEVMEIKGVADFGEFSEDLVRQVSSLLCTRGGVMTVFSVGQALKQTPSGKLVVTGEQRNQTVLERYVVNRGKPVLPNTDSKKDKELPEVRFRVLYSRNLTP